MLSSLVVKSKIEADLITSGACGPGDKLPTIRELTKQYGVSYVTVIEAVRILAQEGKIVKRQGSGVYVSPDTSRAERYPMVRKIGYITNSFAIKNAFGYKILDGIERISRQSGYRLEVANSNGNFLREKEAVAEFVKGGVDGIVLYPAEPRLGSEYLANEFRDVPIVAVDLAKPEMQRPSVVFDNHNAGYEMAKYLITRGRRKIVFYHNALDGTNRAIQDRISGSMRAVEKESGPHSHEIKFSVETWSGNSMKYSYDKLEMLMSSESCPDAIIASSDNQAASVYFWLTTNGYKVPSEIELVGFDNIIPEFMPWLELSEGYHYHWPTTNPDFARLGERAVELLLETIQMNNTINREIVLPCPVLMQRHNANKKSFQKIAIVEVK